VGSRVLPELTLNGHVGVFAAGALTIALAGVALTRIADILADRTGLGEAIAGAVLLGVTTSLAGTVAAVVAAVAGHVDLSISTAVGGIAVQTAFLAVADFFYRQANLEHAAASSTNLVQCTVLVIMLTIPLAAATVPPLTIVGVHPASALLLAIYVFGLRLSRLQHDEPMWVARHTPFTRQDVPEEEGAGAPATLSLLAQFLALALVVCVAGWSLAESGAAIARLSGLSQTLIGTLFTAVSTSLPELVTTVAAVRRGALQLAVGGIIGGNTYDVLFLTFSDVAYREGSLYHAFSDRHHLLVVVSLLMAAVLLLGLLRRETRGPAGIGADGIVILVLYASVLGLQIWQG
jgi:cation:H+ antiporter